MVKRGRVSAAAPFNSFLVFSISTKIAPLGDGTALGLREFFLIFIFIKNIWKMKIEKGVLFPFSLSKL